MARAASSSCWRGWGCWSTARPAGPRVWAPRRRPGGPPAGGLARSAVAVPRARRLLRALAPDAVMGGGGYVAAPVVIAARTLGIPAVLTEADSRIGLTNRALAPLARRVCLSFGPAPASSDGRY